jgi:diguanylate cyclase (GGDEF)-like protein
LQAALSDKVNRQTDLFLKHRLGYRVPVSVRVAPMLDSKGRVVGGVEVFSENSVKLAALEKADNMEQLALTDGLTNAGNRRFTEKILREMGEQYHRGGDSFAILFIDLDNFKDVNDAHGHEAGDAVLKAVSRTITNNLRSCDFLGRWGGDEFIAILTNTDERTKDVADRCCDLVRSCAVPCADCTIHPTVSIGLARIRPGESPTELVARADANLYHAKQAGRDQVNAGPCG